MRTPAFISKIATVLRRRRRAAIITTFVVVVLLAAATWRIARSHADARKTREALQHSVATVAETTPLPRPTTPVHFSDGCMTARCHADLKQVPVLHAPVGQNACGTCHLPDAGNHTYPLRSEPGHLCTQCHNTVHAGKIQHAVLSDDACMACHDPHAGRDRSLLAAGTTQANCVQCHPTHAGQIRHAAAVGQHCEMCHDTHVSDNRGLLNTPRVIDNCRECHAQTVAHTESGAHTHLNVKGSCLGCHNPHAAETKGLLPGPARETCVSCHTDIGTQLADATVTHDPVLKGEACTRCHDPHASDQPAMLIKSQAQVCLSCHDKPVKANDGRTVPAMDSVLTQPVKHGAIAVGECSACHSVHGGNHKKLLREANAIAPHGMYDARNFALCYSCHDARLVTDADRTQFRNGDRNLHEAHLRSGERSMGCGACHAVHGGDLPRLIAKSVNFEGSSWQMPMGFSLTPNGGRCASACHETLEYSRADGGVRTQRHGGTP